MPMRARCVLLLKSGYNQETDGRYFVTSRMDTFIQIEHAGVELIAKTLQPLVHRSADFNFVETAAFVATVSRTTEANPKGMSRFAGRLTNIDPEVRQKFAELSLDVGKKAHERAVFSCQIQRYRRGFEPSLHARIGSIGRGFVCLRAGRPGEHSSESGGGDKSR